MHAKFTLIHETSSECGTICIAHRQQYRSCHGCRLRPHLSARRLSPLFMRGGVPSTSLTQGVATWFVPLFSPSYWRLSRAAEAMRVKPRVLATRPVLPRHQAVHPARVHHRLDNISLAFVRRLACAEFFRSEDRLLKGFHEPVLLAV